MNDHNCVNKRYIVLQVIALILGISHASQAQIATETSSATWPSVGQNLANTRFQSQEKSITASNVGTLKMKWSFTTDGDVSATPTVSNNVVYAPDWAGNLFAISATTGQQIWHHQISEYNGQQGSISRVSPLVLANEIIIGDNMGTPAIHNDGANIIAVNPATGNLKWITQVDSHPAAIITGSPVAFNSVIYVGISSYEESLAGVPGYPCCSFRGSVVALDQTTGRKLWQTFTVEPNGGATDEFSGGAVWEPVAIDGSRSLLYVGTGNNYTVPNGTKQCEAANEASGDTTFCTNPGDHLNSVLALDLKTGSIKWATKVKGYDTWILGCLFPVPAGATPCPKPTGDDLDFTSSGPNLVGNIVGIGEKSGVYWALNPDTGAILWNTTVGPGSAGGDMWGTASDGTNIYLPISDFFQVPYTLVPTGATISWGSWSAINATNGKIVWQTADPSKGALDTGGMSVANGVVFAGSLSGTMNALNAQTGKVLWSFASGGPVIDAPSIVNGVVYWGSGYSSGTPTNPGFRHGRTNVASKIYAFAPGN